MGFLLYIDCNLLFCYNLMLFYFKMNEIFNIIKNMNITINNKKYKNFFNNFCYFNNKVYFYISFLKYFYV
jgi:hypothetical protein